MEDEMDDEMNWQYSFDDWYDDVDDADVCD